MRQAGREALQAGREAPQAVPCTQLDTHAEEAAGLAATRLTPWAAAAACINRCCCYCCRATRLKLLVTSATLDGEKFSAYFNNCPVRGDRQQGWLLLGSWCMPEAVGVLLLSACLHVCLSWGLQQPVAT